MLFFVCSILFILLLICGWLLYNAMNNLDAAEKQLEQMEGADIKQENLEIIHQQIQDLRLILEAIWEMKDYKGEPVLQNLKNAIATTIQKFREYANIHDLEGVDPEVKKKLKKRLAGGEELKV